ncbi:hypothetical protein HMPREF6745_0377 [Prevotella sp. oral taxon 472 str. F0295]|nr:hypothetical protein HMPREF6745_0377 [Prevotella sp. oral taxon 472 str. F0295]
MAFAIRVRDMFVMRCKRSWWRGRFYMRFAPFHVRRQKYNKIDRTTKLFEGYSAPMP